MTDNATRVAFDGGGVILVADVVGPDDGRPILFLHGGGQTRHSWNGALSAAALHGYRAVSLDLRGHGDSGWSPDGRYDMERFSQDVRQVAATFQRPPILVGASLGGLAAMLVAAKPPPDVAGLVLVDVATRLESDGTKEIAAFMTSAPDGFGSLDEAAEAVAAYLPHRKRPSDPSGLMRNLRRRDDGRYRWHWDPALTRQRREEGRYTEAMLDDAARSLRVPTLLVRGGRSRVLSADGAKAFLNLVPHARYVDVAGADHMVAGDANDSFNQAVFEFLGRHLPDET